MKLGSRKAFTLIELLVVIAIIAILAAILFPVFAQAREKARQITCASNLKQLALAVTMYLQDNNETYPQGNAWWGDNWGDGNNQANWSVVIDPYIKSVGVFGCPDDALANQIYPKGNTQMGLTESYAANGLQHISSPYATNCWGMFPTLVLTGIVNDSGVNVPSNTIMLAEVHSDNLETAGDGANWTAGFDNVVTGSPWCVQVNAPNMCGYDDSKGSSNCAADPYPYGANGAISVHNGDVSNFAFADGHVKALNPQVTDPGAMDAGDDWWSIPAYGNSSMWNRFQTAD
jgi:prepilin-type N-terminal cleavage/methylation domain-containing protein/prepilin-type processing-associated H-X9-DG protein